jgi:hypothetical protein
MCSDSILSQIKSKFGSSEGEKLTSIRGIYDWICHGVEHQIVLYVLIVAQTQTIH